MSYQSYQSLRSKQFFLNYIARNNENPRPFGGPKASRKLKRIIDATKEC